MSVAYFVQSHHAIPQLLRLLTTLRRGSPSAPLILGHCPFGPEPPERELARLGVTFFRHRRRARRGFWSLLEPYFDAAEMLRSLGIRYEWLVYLSGQDSPVKPLAEIEQELRDSPYDGYLTWRRAEDPYPDGRRRQGIVRYHYRYRELPRTPWSFRLLRALRPFNGLQGLVHVHLTYGPRLGVRLRALPIPAGHGVHVGSQWTTLRRRCAEEVLRVARDEPRIVSYFEGTICPDEAFAQTCLVGGPFRLHNDNLRFADFTGSKDGRPRVLGLDDAALLESGRYHFARKVEMERDPRLIEWLDRRLAPSA